MDRLVEEFAHPTTLGFAVITARLVLAALFGALIGLEREWRQRPAGLRTHMLVCIASATFAILTIEIVHLDMFDRDVARFDPIRIVEAVTAGVAFLAAGVVIFSRGEVRGLTTGAGLWLAGAIGVSTGLGLWQVAALATVLTLIVLSLLHLLEKQVESGGQSARAQAEEEDGDHLRLRPENPSMPLTSSEAGETKARK